MVWVFLGCRLDKIALVECVLSAARVSVCRQVLQSTVQLSS